MYRQFALLTAAVAIKLLHFRPVWVHSVKKIDTRQLIYVCVPFSNLWKIGTAKLM